MSARPSRDVADRRLRIKLGADEAESVTLVRCEGWDGVKNRVAFSGVLLLEGATEALGVVVIVRNSGRRWDVILQPQAPGKAVEPLAFYLREVADLRAGLAVAS